MHRRLPHGWHVLEMFMSKVLNLRRAWASRLSKCHTCNGSRSRHTRELKKRKATPLAPSSESIGVEHGLQSELRRTGRSEYCDACQQSSFIRVLKARFRSLTSDRTPLLPGLRILAFRSWQRIFPMNPWETCLLDQRLTRNDPPPPALDFAASQEANKISS